MSGRATLSVLMPNFNHARFLPESLDAILSQSFRPGEVIVLDDASTDDSVKVIEDVARRDPIVRVVRNERNMGVDWTVNRLFELSNGDYIYSPSADDKVLPGFFEKCMSVLTAHPDAGLCSTVGRLIADDGADLGIRSLPVVSSSPRYFSPDETRRLLFRYGKWIDSGSVIFRRACVLQEGGARTELGSFSDSFLNLVIALRHGACFVPEPLACWRQTKNGYAARTARDVDRIATIGDRTVQLMSTSYSDLFPPDYVRRFRRHWEYVVTIASGERLREEQAAAIARASGEMGARWSAGKSGVLGLMRATVRLNAAVWRLYAMVTLGPWRWWLAGRLSILGRLGTFKMRERLGAR